MGPLLFIAGLAIAICGLIALFKPLPSMGLGTRGKAGGAIAAGFALFVFSVSIPLDGSFVWQAALFGSGFALGSWSRGWKRVRPKRVTASPGKPLYPYSEPQTAPASSAARSSPISSAKPATKRRSSASVWSGQEAVDAVRRADEFLEGATRVQFTYCDADGVVTERDVILWTIEPERFMGLCADQRAERSFRKDRVLEWTGKSEA